MLNEGLIEVLPLHIRGRSIDDAIIVDEAQNISQKT
jgi:predicted ribonuclease YlaK